MPTLDEVRDALEGVEEASLRGQKKGERASGDGLNFPLWGEYGHTGMTLGEARILVPLFVLLVFTGLLVIS